MQVCLWSFVGVVSTVLIQHRRGWRVRVSCASCYKTVSFVWLNNIKIYIIILLNYVCELVSSQESRKKSMSKNISKWTCSNTKSPTWEAPKIVFLRRFFWLFSFHQWWFFLPLFQVSCYLALFDWTCDQPFVEHTLFDFIHRSCSAFSEP